MTLIRLNCVHDKRFMNSRRLIMFFDFFHFFDIYHNNFLFGLCSVFVIQERFITYEIILILNIRSLFCCA